MIWPRLLMAATVCFWGWSFVATKMCLEYMTPLEVIGIRCLLGLPVLLLVIVAKRMPVLVSRRDLKPIAWAALVITAHYLIQVTGMQYTTATNTGWLISTTPLALVVLSAIFLKERITSGIIIGIALASIGVLLLVSRGNLLDLGWLRSVGDWMVLGSAHTWAVYTVVSRNVSRRNNPLLVSFLVLALSAVGLVGGMAATTDWSGFFHLPLDVLLAVVFLGVVCHGLAFWFWQEGVSRLGASRAGVFLYLEPLATTALAVPYLNESFGLYTGLGGLLVLAGVYLSERGQGKRA